MNRLGTILSVAALAASFAIPALAEMTIHLKDGRSFTLPIDPQDVASMTFGPGLASQTSRGLTTAAPTHLGAMRGVPPVPGVPQPAATASLVPPPSMAEAGTQPHASGRVLRVGPSRDIKTIHAAADQAKDGDTIEIDAGNYLGDVAVWKASNLTIRGVGGRPHLDADGEAAQGKGIWVTAGNNIRIENIEFSGAKVGDNNGAGIRAEGANLTIFNCYFHDNQEGILAADNADSDIVIDSSAFVHNGTQSGQTHGIYINHIRTLFVRGSVFQDTTIGHHIKTRAENDYILYNRILDFADGTASYSIDMSNGGRGYIIGNVIEKGPKADNYTMIAIAMEGPTLPEQEVYVVGNTMVLDRSSGIFVHSRSPGTTVVADNIMAGPGVPLQGNGRLINNVIAGGSTSGLDANGGGGNRVVRDIGFVDPSRFDYHLKPGSPAIGAGVDMQQVNGFKLMPEYENLYPLGVAPRPASNPPDDGAYRFVSAAR
ncbi:MAG TPA: right-handed parallel beta-helix repeat-containing protein [Stellaceae bacterium]|nr:right-handed parallel beta-helix repeat-containing protein [Stellaceae bacterium]